MLNADVRYQAVRNGILNQKYSIKKFVMILGLLEPVSVMWPSEVRNIALGRIYSTI
jgi:hypothetical protein